MLIYIQLLKIVLLTVFLNKARTAKSSAHLVYWNCFGSHINMCLSVRPPKRALTTSRMMWYDIGRVLLYSLLVFEIVFTATVISWVSHIRGGRGRGVLGVGGQAECEPSLPLSHNESLILGHNLDFSSCDILVSFCKPSHIYACMHLTNYVCIIKLKL